MPGTPPYTAIVIGGSAGGREALVALLAQLPPNFPTGIAVVLHMHPHSDARDVALSLGGQCRLVVSEAEEKQPLLPGRVYLAPANYHLLLEPDGRFALSIDPKVKHSRPSIDVLFESAAEAFGNRLIGIVLSGASSDGAAGLERIKARGGYIMVQQPDTASSPLMPRSAIAYAPVDQVLSPAELGRALVRLTMAGEGPQATDEVCPTLDQTVAPPEPTP